MKKYVVAYVNLFDNELKLKTIIAENEIVAIKSFLINETIDKNLSEEEYVELHSSLVDYINSLSNSVEEIKNELIQTDILIEIIEI